MMENSSSSSLTALKWSKRYVDLKIQPQVDGDICGGEL